MYKHYIRVDDVGRIIHGFSDYYDTPQDGDILLRENNDKEFRLFGKNKNIPLSYQPIAAQRPLYLYKYKNGQPAERTPEELEADFPPLYHEPTDIDVLLELSADHEERLCMLELGV